ncbi:hypothetical protein N1028_18695 [Herbiconiux sp. CPCC 203407]|uniref:Uncharacterized protein n=1 Tax=Herbiconiux oxytropis TaxID=2970915 RepID=A0AA41XKV9_9MICO|nr:hypothetical protein [Herbiconiux oxytropis]MCS5723422.1 hypothetical protein [Herbiconiux oxytropis]MCS5727931.1 hypothetical protein [Herbiconiux oxytropis]
MRTRRLAPLLVATAALALLAGCSPTAYVEPEPPKFTQSLNEVLDASEAAVETIVGEFPGASLVTGDNANVYDCAGEDADIGRWLWAGYLTSDDIAGAISRLQDEYGDAVTSTGTAAQDVEYTDGTIWPVVGPHTLIEDEAGSYLLTYPSGAEGTVMIRVTTPCGVLR